MKLYSVEFYTRETREEKDTYVAAVDAVAALRVALDAWPEHVADRVTISLAGREFAMQQGVAW